ncbi:MAG TPA: hypothetical protein VFW60_02290 [Rhodanobacteraceae bacterium]|nr:hypothetical protein [Rhodanobacteraceae bacterium]
MDNHQRLIEDLPARLSPGRSQRVGEKAIREAVAVLPLANPAQAVHEVEQLLDGMLATTWAGAERIIALEHLRVPVENLCTGIERQLGGEPHPLPAAAAEWAAAAQRLQWMMMCGYATGLHELCAPAGRLPRFKGKFAAIAAVRGLVHANHMLTWSYRQYQSPPTGGWRRIHALHAFAGELGVADQAIRDPADGASSTPRSAYARVLLLAMSDPHRFSARELQEARQVIHCVADQCGLERAGAEGTGVDTGSDLGPFWITAERLANGSGLLALDVSAVQRVLDERIALLPAGVDAIDLRQPGGGVLTTSARFLNRLRAGWGIAPRGHVRLAAGHALEIVVGMHALHYALAGDLDFSTFVRRVHGDAIMVGTHELASAWLGTADATRPQVFRAEVLDQSEGGYRVRLHGADGLRMRVGEVIGLAPGGDEDERDWMVGVIRWLCHDSDGELLGIELLRREARAAGLRPVTADGETLAPLRAVELLNGQRAEHLSLLVTNGLARNIVAAEVVLPALASDWNSRAVVATWRTGETEALGPACFRVTLERDEATSTT